MENIQLKDNELRWNNFYYRINSRRKNCSKFRCKTDVFCASISLKAIEFMIQQPIEATNLNQNHKEGCVAYDDEYFEVKSFVKTVKQITKRFKQANTTSL